MRMITSAALAALLATSFVFGASAMSHGGKSAAREAFNAALDKCEEMQGDQRSDCMDQAMQSYREAREKEQMEGKK
jgi:ribosomal protein S7